MAQSDDILVQHVAMCTTEQIIEVRLIPQKFFQEHSVQVDKDAHSSSRSRRRYVR